MRLKKLVCLFRAAPATGDSLGYVTKTVVVRETIQVKGRPVEVFVRAEVLHAIGSDVGKWEGDFKEKFNNLVVECNRSLN